MVEQAFKPLPSNLRQSLIEEKRKEKPVSQETYSLGDIKYFINRTIKKREEEMISTKESQRIV